MVWFNGTLMGQLIIIEKLLLLILQFNNMTLFSTLFFTGRSFGIAVGAQLVSVKVLNNDHGSVTGVIDGLYWVFNNRYYKYINN